jgi:hypothetical protein
MSIRLVEDVGAPAAVTAIDMLTLEMAPAYNEIASYVMTGAGYLAGFFLKGKVADFMTSMGVASLPLTARAIRERVKQPVSQRVGTSRLVLQHRPANTGSPVTRSYQPEFETVGPYAF